MTAKTFKHKSQIDKQKVYIKTNINSFLPSLGCSTVWSEYGTHLVLPDSVQSQLLMPEERNQQKENTNLFFFFLFLKFLDAVNISTTNGLQSILI